MLSEDNYFQTLSEEELWQRYCGFLYLDPEKFMAIQEELLLDSIGRLAQSTLGKKIMNGRQPRSVLEFRQQVPITKYDDYNPYLQDCDETALSEKPYFWTHSSGRGGYFKWIPHSVDSGKRAARNLLASFILASAKREGEIAVAPGLRLLSILPPRPYASGWLVSLLNERFTTQVIPRIELSETSDFEERVSLAVKKALLDGADVAGAISSVLVRMGETFTDETSKMRISREMLHPKIVIRLMRALLRARRNGEPMLPKHIWPLKGIVSSGMDTAMYKNNILHYWGVEPYEFYASTEAGFIAMQAWNKKALTFLPDSVFLEFIPISEGVKFDNEKNYQPTTVLADELKEGCLYEVIITQLFGMPLLRYRLRDIIKVVAKRDSELGINLPQISFQRRVGETINLASLAEIDERTIWQAIVNSELKYVDWMASKEYDADQSYLRVYIELKENRTVDEIQSMIDKELKLIDPDYRDVGAYLKLQPVKVTILQCGTFERYTTKKKQEGADLAHLKPSRMNPADAEIQVMLELSQAIFSS